MVDANAQICRVIGFHLGMAQIYHALVVAHGKVQGVFYRDTIRRSALARSVAGSAVNAPDGTVKMQFEGDQSAVEAMIDVARAGPPSAQVTQLDVEWTKPTGAKGFHVR
jgi:acylphosphatase